MYDTMNSEEIVGIIAISGGVAIVVLLIVFRALVKMHRVKETEASRREIAAYVAEGSMSPDDGEKLLAAGNEKGGSRC